MPAQATKVDGLVGETQSISLLLTQASLLRQFYLLPTKAHSVGFHLLTSNQHGQLSQMITDGFSLIPNNRLIELEKQWLPIKRSYYFEKKSLKVTLSPKYQTWLNEHPVIKVGLVTNWSPMESVDKYGDYIGINPDFFRLLEDRIGVNFQYVSFDKWQNVLAAVEARTVDMIASVSVTDTRKAFLNFSDPYWNMPWGLLHPVTGGKKASLSDFENESVAAIAGIHIIDVIKQKFPNIKFVEVEKLEEGYLLLQQGNVAALVTSIAPASELLKRESLITMGLSVLDNLAVDTEQFGIRNDWPEFLEIVNQALSSVTEQEINNITDRWFNVEITTGYEKDVVIKLAIQIGIFIVIVLAVIVFWNRRLYSEIKQRKALEIKMKHMATHDDLTGLANRTLLTERIKSAINFHQRQRLSLAVLFIDLDGFKHVNDNFGHHVGDELLIQLTARLKSCVREYDTVARFGGDEFVLLITGLHDKQEAAFIAEKALKVIRRPVELSATTVSVSCSIGIAAFPNDGDTDTELLKVADTLMYRVKAHGKNHYIFN